MKTIPVSTCFSPETLSGIKSEYIHKLVGTWGRVARINQLPSGLFRVTYQSEFTVVVNGNTVLELESSITTWRQLLDFLTENSQIDLDQNLCFLDSDQEIFSAKLVVATQDDVLDKEALVLSIESAPCPPGFKEILQ